MADDALRSNEGESRNPEKPDHRLRWKRPKKINVRKRNYWTKYGDKARSVLSALLDKYAESGIENIEDMSVLKVEPLKNLGTPQEIVAIFGDKQKYLAALKELKDEIYLAA